MNIEDLIKLSDVMVEHSLGPNGGELIYCYLFFKLFSSFSFLSFVLFCFSFSFFLDFFLFLFCVCVFS